MNFLLKFLRPAPHLPEIEDKNEVKEKYKYWRIRIMYSTFIGYTLYYLTRKSFSAAMPGISQDLGLDKGELGVMGTVLALSYGISKFFSGVLSDQSNPRYFMSIGLILTGVLNIFLGFSSSLWLFAVFWALNGWFQGFGWPPCVKLLSNWYSHSERGSWWSSWAVSQNIGAFLTPWIVGLCLNYLGWRYAMFVPGIVCIAGGLFLMNRLSDVPRSQGLPTIEKYRNDYPDKTKKGAEEETLTAKERIMSVLKNKFIWALAIAYFFIYFIRSGLEWAPFFMIETKGYSLLKANGIASLVEVGGFLGMLSAGWVSDKVFGARRGPVNALFALLLSVGLFGLWFSSGTVEWVDSALLFLIGFSIFGPQMLIGVAVSEFAHKNSTATATGLAGWVAYVGSAAAGAPLGKIIDYLGWNGFLASMVISSLVALLLLLPLWGITHTPQKKVEAS